MRQLVTADLCLLLLQVWHFRPNIQHSTSVPECPANHNPIPNPKPNPTDSTNPTLLGLTLGYMNVWPKISTVLQFKT